MVQGAGNSMAGEWVLAGPAGQCRLLLTTEVAEPRAAGSLPPPMFGARQEGDCPGLSGIGGWRRTADGVELVDHYGQLLVRLSETSGGSFENEQTGLRLSAS